MAYAAMESNSFIDLDNVFTVTRVEVVQQIDSEQLKAGLRRLFSDVALLSRGPKNEEIASLRGDLQALRNEMEALRTEKATSDSRLEAVCLQQEGLQELLATRQLNGRAARGDVLAALEGAQTKLVGGLLLTVQGDATQPQPPDSRLFLASAAAVQDQNAIFNAGQPGLSRPASHSSITRAISSGLSPTPSSEAADGRPDALKEQETSRSKLPTTSSNCDMGYDSSDVSNLATADDGQMGESPAIMGGQIEGGLTQSSQEDPAAGTLGTQTQQLNGRCPSDCLAAQTTCSKLLDRLDEVTAQLAELSDMKADRQDVGAVRMDSHQMFKAAEDFQLLNKGALNDLAIEVAKKADKESLSQLQLMLAVQGSQGTNSMVEDPANVPQKHSAIASEAYLAELHLLLEQKADKAALAALWEILAEQRGVQELQQLKGLYPERAVGGVYPMPQPAVAVQIQQLQDAVEIVAHATHAVAVNQLDAPRPHASLDMQSSFTTSDVDEYLVSKAGGLNSQGSLSSTGHTSSRMASSPGHSQELMSGYHINYELPASARAQQEDLDADGKQATADASSASTVGLVSAYDAPQEIIINQHKSADMPMPADKTGAAEPFTSVSWEYAASRIASVVEPPVAGIFAVLDPADAPAEGLTVADATMAELPAGKTAGLQLAASSAHTDNLGAIVEASEGTDVLLQLKAVGVQSGRGNQQTAVPKNATLSAAALPAVAPTPVPSDAGQPAQQREAENEMNSSMQSLVPEAGRYVMKHAHSGSRRSQGGGKVDVVPDPKILTPMLSPESIAPRRLEAAAGQDSESWEHLSTSIQGAYNQWQHPVLPGDPNSVRRHASSHQGIVAALQELLQSGSLHSESTTDPLQAATTKEEVAELLASLRRDLSILQNKVEDSQDTQLSSFKAAGILVRRPYTGYSCVACNTALPALGLYSPSSGPALTAQSHALPPFGPRLPKGGWRSMSPASSSQTGGEGQRASASGGRNAPPTATENRPKTARDKVSRG